ncbi:Glutaredoxin domain-containing cysteine-rich protein CG31559 [Eumeta japonica]|uniref:Glutaredoxin domain-containing cysteine-rich protein CG31559 n=1 Tax=Eumeta variegata TaxID=151549 RepID=A0A4C1VMF0_EUMVA|nr:Glutaredoxin domain-containing cysteine-rich protein CG31559 [Eumeta japonica]
MGIVRSTYQRCMLVKKILRNLLVKYEERDVFMSTEYQDEIRDRMKSEKILVPQLFVDGQHIGTTQLSGGGPASASLNSYSADAILSKRFFFVLEEAFRELFKHKTLSPPNAHEVGFLEKVFLLKMHEKIKVSFLIQVSGHLSSPGACAGADVKPRDGARPSTPRLSDDTRIENTRTVFCVHILHVKKNRGHAVPLTAHVTSRHDAGAGGRVADPQAAARRTGWKAAILTQFLRPIKEVHALFKLVSSGRGARPLSPWPTRLQLERNEKGLAKPMLLAATLVPAAPL